MNQHPQSSVAREHRGHRRARALVSVTLLALALTLLVALAPSAQASAKYAGTIRDGRAAARALLEQTGAPSLSLALISHGHIVWRQSFGYADVGTQTAPAPTTMYGLGSVSKTLATVAVMQLVDEGKVDLDEPVVTYLPKFRMASPGYRAVTVRMLLDHSSGFPGSAYASAWTAEFWPGYLDQVMTTLAQTRLKHTPGALSVYCNDGFTVLEELVLAVTGRSFTDYMQEDVFAPLGMTHTAYPLQDFADGSYAKAYDPDGTVHPRETLNLPASGALYSTPSDMARLATMLMDRGAYGDARILSAASVAEMGSDQTVGEIRPSVYDSARYGLGWDSVTQPGLKKAGLHRLDEGRRLQRLPRRVLRHPRAEAGRGRARRGAHQLGPGRGSLRAHPAPRPGRPRRPAPHADADPRRRAGGQGGVRLPAARHGGLLGRQRPRASRSPPAATRSHWRSPCSRAPTGNCSTAACGCAATASSTARAARPRCGPPPPRGAATSSTAPRGGYGHYRDNMPLAQKLKPG